MTAVILLLAAICLVLLEQKWAAYALRSLDVHTQCDHYLAEPGQPVTWSITVENHSRLPIPFVRFVQSFPNEAKSHADKAWWKSYCRKGILSWDAEFSVQKLGDMDTEMAKEFFYAISYTAGMNLHIKVLTPGNNHHMMEAMFKAFAKALDMALSPENRTTEVLSTKGSL